MYFQIFEAFFSPDRINFAPLSVKIQIFFLVIVFMHLAQQRYAIEITSTCPPSLMHAYQIT